MLIVAVYESIGVGIFASIAIFFEPEDPSVLFYTSYSVIYHNVCQMMAE